jgi:hypothetical protein
VHIHIDHSGQAPTAATVTSSGASPPEQVAAEYVDAYAHYDRARRKSVLGGDALANWPNLSNYNRADEAIEFTILLDRCSPQPGAGTDTSVTCTFDMHGFGPRQPANPVDVQSVEIGRRTPVPRTHRRRSGAGGSSFIVGMPSIPMR